MALSGNANNSIFCDEDEWIGTTTTANVLEGDKIDKMAIILGADMQRTNRTGTVIDRAQIIRVGNFVALTRAGRVDHADHLANKVTDYVHARTNRFIDIASMMEHVYDAVLDDIKNGLLPAQHGGSITLGGYNRGSLQPQLFFMNNAGLLNLMETEIPYVKGNFQTGSGAGGAFVFLNGRFSKNSSLQHGKELVIHTIYSAIRSDSLTGEVIQVIVIKPISGAGQVETIEIEEYERRYAPGNI